MKLLMKFLKLLVFFSSLSFSVNAQSSNNLRTMFGSPLKEFYQVNENVWLNVEYGQDSQLCSAAVTEKYSFTDKKPIFGISNQIGELKKSANDVYTEIIKNLSPSLKIGKPVNRSKNEIGNCFNRTETEYENVYISSNDQVCGEATPRRYYFIKWKRKECKNTGKQMVFWRNEDSDN